MRRRPLHYRAPRVALVPAGLPDVAIVAPSAAEVAVAANAWAPLSATEDLRVIAGSALDLSQQLPASPTRFHGLTLPLNPFGGDAPEYNTLPVPGSTDLGGGVLDVGDAVREYCAHIKRMGNLVRLHYGTEFALDFGSGNLLPDLLPATIAARVLPQRLRMMQAFATELTRIGVAYCLDICTKMNWATGYVAGAGNRPYIKAEVHWSASARAVVRATIDAVWNAPNPYDPAGRSILKLPAAKYAVVINEGPFEFVWPAGSLPAALRTLADPAFNVWLKAEYSTRSAFDSACTTIASQRAASNDVSATEDWDYPSSGSSLITLPSVLKGSGTETVRQWLAGRWIKAMQEGLVSWAQAEFASLGVTVPVTNGAAAGTFLDDATRLANSSGVAVLHQYAGLFSNGNNATTQRTLHLDPLTENQASAVAESAGNGSFGGYMGYMLRGQLLDGQTNVEEHAVDGPNKHRHKEVAVMAAAAAAGVTMSTPFGFAPRLRYYAYGPDGNYHYDCCRVGELQRGLDPVHLANDRAQAFMLARGDVRAASDLQTIAFIADPADYADPTKFRGLGSPFSASWMSFVHWGHAFWLARIGITTPANAGKYGWAVPFSASTQTVWGQRLSLTTTTRTPPALTPQFSPGVAGRLDEVLLRARGGGSAGAGEYKPAASIVPAGNRTDLLGLNADGTAKGLIEHATGQIILGATTRCALVSGSTESGGLCRFESLSQADTLVACDGVDLAAEAKYLKVRRLSRDATLWAASLDGADLRASSRVLLCLNSNARNSSQVPDTEDGLTATRVGTLTGRVTLSVTASAGATSLSVSVGASSSLALKAGDTIVFYSLPDMEVTVAADVTLGANTAGTITLTAPGLPSAVSANSAISAYVPARWSNAGTGPALIRGAIADVELVAPQGAWTVYPLRQTGERLSALVQGVDVGRTAGRLAVVLRAHVTVSGANYPVQYWEAVRQ